MCVVENKYLKNTKKIGVVFGIVIFILLMCFSYQVQFLGFRPDVILQGALSLKQCLQSVVVAIVSFTLC